MACYVSAAGAAMLRFGRPLRPRVAALFQRWQSELHGSGPDATVLQAPALSGVALKARFARAQVQGRKKDLARAQVGSPRAVRVQDPSFTWVIFGSLGEGGGRQARL